MAPPRLRFRRFWRLLLLSSLSGSLRTGTSTERRIVLCCRTHSDSPPLTMHLLSPQAWMLFSSAGLAVSAPWFTARSPGFSLAWLLPWHRSPHRVPSAGPVARTGHTGGFRGNLPRPRNPNPPPQKGDSAPASTSYPRVTTTTVSRVSWARPLVHGVSVDEPGRRVPGLGSPSSPGG